MTMNFKSIKAEKTTETRDSHELEKSGTGNLFETIVVLSKRSNQLAVEMKQELNAKLEEFITPTDSLEEVFENREQIEISKFYERLPKPHSVALAEMGEGLLGIDVKEEAEEESREVVKPARKRGRPKNSSSAQINMDPMYGKIGNALVQGRRQSP
mgnify:CR=1 FL=1